MKELEKTVDEILASASKHPVNKEKAKQRIEALVKDSNLALLNRIEEAVLSEIEVTTACKELSVLWIDYKEVKSRVKQLLHLERKKL